MRLHALLAWFDEPVALLIACIASLKDAGVDHVVALDGRYDWFPDDATASDPNQAAAIVMTCRNLGIACTLHTPTEPYTGEPAKRTALFALGWALADPGDWFMVHDADTVIAKWPDDTRSRLEQTDCEVAKVEVLDTVALRAKQKDWPPTFEYCSLFRARPITCGPHHAVYTGEDGQALWIGNGVDPPVPALDLTATVQVEHRPDHRSNARQVAKLNGYAQRDQARVERTVCSRCDEPSVRLVTINWRWSDIGPVGDWAEACETHARVLEARSRRELRRLGIDPLSVVPENRNGKAPETISTREAIGR